MQTIVDGYNIEYRISGNGSKTIVILQGWGTSFDFYNTIADCFDESFRVIQFDLPGFGKSDEPREPWDVDAYANFFCMLMEKLNIQHTTLIGHSYGGRVIIKLATRDSIPFEIDRIVLIDSAGIIPRKTWLQRLNIKKYKLLKNLFNIKVVYALFPELVDDWRNRQGSADYRNATPMMRQCLVKAVNEDLTDLLPRIKQDTLLIWGDKDTATPISDAKIMEDKIPNSGLVILEGAGHFSYLEKPEIFRSIMKSYFGIGV